jgi:hypothetical protein
MAQLFTYLQAVAVPRFCVVAVFDVDPLCQCGATLALKRAASLRRRVFGPDKLCHDFRAILG